MDRHERRRAKTLTKIDAPSAGYPEDFVRQMVELANRTREHLEDSIDAYGDVKNIIASNDIVMGVWQDPAEKFGVGLLLLKGHHVAREACASGMAQRALFAAIPWECYEQAMAAKLMCGEGGAGLDAQGSHHNEPTPTP